MNAFSQERPRVLIVDDKKNWREVLCDMLEPMYEIETAASYDEAKHKLWQRAFHVLVADQRLVDLDNTNIQGILLLDEVAKLRDGTQSIIVTGYPTVEAAKEALKGRDARDYILKYPDKGGPFDIRKYREQVKQAAEEAIQARQKAITLDFSVWAVVASLKYDRIAETLFPGDVITDRIREDVSEVVNRLLYPLQPLAFGMGKAWLSKPDQVCEILCWSRGYGKAALVRIGKKQHSLKTRKVEWLRDNWRLVKNDEFVSAPFVGISHTIAGMTFEDFASLVEGKTHGK
jgi:ActR/RegA family two-component response regulator